MPAVSTIVPASMTSFPTRTRPGSMDWTGVDTWMSAPRRPRVNARLDEACPPQGGADRLRAVPQFQPPRAGFKQERGEDEEILAADKRNLDIAPTTQTPLEVARRGHATKASAEYDNTHGCLPPSHVSVASGVVTSESFHLREAP